MAQEVEETVVAENTEKEASKEASKEVSKEVSSGPVSIKTFEDAIRNNIGNIAHLEIINEANSCSNMKIRVTIVSDDFVSKIKINRYRMVQEALKQWLDDGTIHAITIYPYTTQKWAQISPQ